MFREELLFKFNYVPESGILIWKNPPKGKSNLLGKTAGYLRVKNESLAYFYVGVNGKVYAVHRIIWFLETGKMPNFIDHINGDTKDNRFKNLRNVDNRTNCLNKAIHRAGKLPGVSWDKKRKKWLATIQLQGKRKFLGRFNTEIEAHKIYLSKLETIDV